MPYCSNGLFLIFGFRALWRSGQSARMSKIKNSRLDQCGAEPFKQQKFGTANAERVELLHDSDAQTVFTSTSLYSSVQAQSLCFHTTTNRLHAVADSRHQNDTEQ